MKKVIFAALAGLVILTGCAGQSDNPADASLSQAKRELAKRAGVKDAEAALLLSQHYLQGTLSPKDDDVTTYMALALSYEQGKGVAADTGEAGKWYQKAAELGDAEAQFKYASLQSKPSLASGWYFKAAKQGHARAQYQVAMNYYHGQNTKVQPERALLYIKKSAVRGYAPAQFEFGRLQLEGVHTDKNLKAAAYWLNKAVEQGHDEALALLDTFTVTK